MYFKPIAQRAPNNAVLQLDHDELVVLNRLLAKTMITAARSEPQEEASVSCQAVQLATRIYKFRRRRDARTDELFGRGLFADPAWDMLLDLFIHNAQGINVSVTSACVGSNAPPTTALRHLAEFERRGMVERRQHPTDGRVWLANLTIEAMAMMHEILRDFAELMSGDSPEVAERGAPRDC